MKNVSINGKNFEIVKNYKDGFDLEEVTSKLTDYFDNFNYIAGDWAYGKLRLKGFYDSKNKNVREYNNVKNFDNYIKNYCANDCRFFLLKKID